MLQVDDLVRFTNKYLCLRFLQFNKRGKNQIMRIVALDKPSFKWVHIASCHRIVFGQVATLDATHDVDGKLIDLNKPLRLHVGFLRLHKRPKKKWEKKVQLISRPKRELALEIM